MRQFTLIKIIYSSTNVTISDVSEITRIQAIDNYTWTIKFLNQKDSSGNIVK